MSQPSLPTLYVEGRTDDPRTLLRHVREASPDEIARTDYALCTRQLIVATNTVTLEGRHIGNTAFWAPGPPTAPAPPPQSVRPFLIGKDIDVRIDGKPVNWARIAKVVLTIEPMVPVKLELHVNPI